MKQIFDWLRRAILDKAFKIYDGTIAVDIHDVGELINEAEAKWEAEVCEWEHEDYIYYDHFQCDCGEFFTTMSYIGDFRFCPYCGKPIKISGLE